MIKLRNIDKVLVVLAILDYLFEWGPVIVLGVFLLAIILLVLYGNLLPQSGTLS